ncbi:ABC transporter ATP-binding protein/permease [Fictibacillus sp. KIGAM418]|uniref:ABC transporter ATP-binding protein/permease n=1 Tax=Fictibacillus marinisediminis TaxID=2878389 RepID=A0A9X1X8H0_9BACL|nr:ABC transporter ATP-binding protein [Fictibacillus marinisediminis]MCK6255843.1 ABC transporter ATP-binding protein/permease [Fictibacillus marinisediminis]
MNVGKRLFRYALIYKKSFIIGLLLLALAVSAELTGPFIAKRMIDVHILGIEKPWYKTTAQDKDTVTYKGSRYQREDRFQSGEPKGKQARITQIGRKYYFINQSAKLEGEKSYKNKEIMVTSKGVTTKYPAVQLKNSELFKFYKPEIRGLFKLTGIYFVLLLFAGLFQYGQRYMLQSSSNLVIKKLRQDVFSQIQRVPITYFDNQPAGKIVSRVTNDTEAIKELFVNVLSNFFTGIIYMAGIFTALFILDMRLALITMILVPILVVWITLYRKLASKYNHIIRSTLSDINGMVNESIQGMPIIRAFKRQKETTKEFEEMNEKYFSFQNRLLSLNGLTSHNLVSVLRNLAFVALIWYFGGASLKTDALISVGVLYAFVDYLNRLFQPITGMVNQLAQLEQALVSAERVFVLLDEPGMDVKVQEVDRYKGNVTFNGVSFAYKEGENVLNDITFEARQGETVALVGHTGSGKSSIMNLLFRFYDIKQGRILIDGKDIMKMPKQVLREHMGIVLQDPFLFTGTIASNISLDDPAISREMVEKAITDVGAMPFVQILPKGLDEPVIEKGSTLSSGQRQLLSFARALAFNPAILILDEATASIDTETEAIIQEALDVLKRGRTTFIIAHRLSTIKNADQILVLDRGRIVEKGDHTSLMEARGRYFQMYQIQQGQKASKAV